jgi:hypothetical protein
LTNDHVYEEAQARLELSGYFPGYRAESVPTGTIQAR